MESEEIRHQSQVQNNIIDMINIEFYQLPKASDEEI